MDDSEVRRATDANWIAKTVVSYVAQAALLTGFTFFFLIGRRSVRGVVLVVPVLWFIGVSLIYLRYGAIGQWSFYQNDQYFHWRVVNEFLTREFNLTFDRLNFLRVPYTAPAFLLSVIGIDATLALKYVSLVCALVGIYIADTTVRHSRPRLAIPIVWGIAAPITIFFSLLALRETMMIMCVTHLFLGKSTSRKALSLLTLVILRPHLAAAVVVGQCWGWLLCRLRNRWYLPSVLATAVLPIYLGTIGFSVGNYIIYRLPIRLYQDLFLQSQVVQIFSAFAGLQFLTVAYQTVEYTTRSLLLIRLIFPEIVLVPLIFSISCLFYTPQTTRLKLSILSTFVFFMAVSSGTEYLSVRQSLPMMPIMGVAAILSFSRATKINLGTSNHAIPKDVSTPRAESFATS